MEMQALFLMEKKSMIANSLIQGLEKAGFRVTGARPNVTEMGRFAADASCPPVWILFLQGTDHPVTDVLSYLREQIGEKQIRLFVIGTEEEIDVNLGVFPRHECKGIFTRPFRTDEVVDRILMEAMNAQRLAESKRVLVIDDDATMLRTYKDMLSNRYRVYTANSGMNAIQMLVHTGVDLILLDYEMPVINGPQILEMLRSEPHTRDIPVMFLTSKSDRDSIIRVMSLGPANYLLKSLPKSEIIKQVEVFFEQQDLKKQQEDVREEAPENGETAAGQDG